jgi:RNA polymerase sigma-70 factor (ECF subfamily)
MNTTGRESPSRTEPLDLADLYSRYSGIVVAYLRGQRANDPEDLASEVFLGVMRGLERFEGDEAAFRSWLLVIAHRRLLDERRQLGRRPSHAVEPERLDELFGADQSVDVERSVLAHFHASKVVAALDVLTEDQRTVVLLHAIGDLSLPQIAQILRKRLGAVKSLHQRGLIAAANALGSPAAWNDSDVLP